MSDQEFLDNFFGTKLTQSCWTHEAHLRLGWTLLKRHSFDEALNIAREGIQSLNAVIGARVGYHETITRAFLLLIHHEMQKTDVQTFSVFKEEAKHLFERDLAPLKPHYSWAHLYSDAAKKDFKEPDLLHLPLAGVVREVKSEDVYSLIKIYAPYIEGSATSFELTAPSTEEMRQRIQENKKLGWYVYEHDGQILGYAYASKHRARAAYQWCCEVSAYVDERHHRRGIAALLYGRLLGSLKQKGFVNAYAGITLPNEKSVGFHEALGFKLIGVYQKIGFKLGQWHDVGWWALRINEATNNPAMPSLGGTT